MAGGEIVHDMQEAGHGPGHDYVHGSPHLEHPWLRDRIVANIVAAVRASAPDGRAPRVLEVGAGHGSLTAELVAAGARVTVTEMSGPSADRLRARFASHGDAVRVVHDPDGRLEIDESDGPVDAVVYVSVLHHIPDYLAAVRRASDLLSPGGTLVSFQDPLWYPRQSRFSLLASRAVYYAWRLGEGSFARGLATVRRRWRGVYDESNPSDMVEYHVVRQGVDEQALVAELTPRFDGVRLVPYFSTQSAWGQRVGERVLPVNTFGLIATGRRGDERDR